MKFNKKINKIGDKKIKKFFAILPVSVYHESVIEIRWMEWVTVEKIYWVSWYESGWSTHKFLN